MVIGVIGSRRMSEYGRQVTVMLVKSILNKGWKIVTADTPGINRLVKGLGGDNAEIIKGANFELINREIVDKCDKLVIIEGGEKSGTLLVAAMMIDEGKEVWAVPGRITDESASATNFLIKNGANILTETDDLV